MNFRFADSFQKALTRLTSDEQSAVKSSAFDLQMDPSHPGLQTHRLSKTKDPDWWSARVNKDVRMIYHQRGGDVLLCYVDHHDDAYDWAKRRKIETHPKTGAAQLVEVRESVKEIVVPVYTTEEVASPKQPSPQQPPPPPDETLRQISREELLEYAVPDEWVDDVLAASDDTDSLLEVCGHLPGEAAEAVLQLASGERPEKPAAVDGNPFDHPDAQRRFKLVADNAELAAALEAPWDRWTVFLHPDQRQTVAKSYNGPARVSGSAGTGKTVVALHRAARLAKIDPAARILLTTFSEPLATLLRDRVKLLFDDQVIPDRMTIAPLERVVRELSASTGAAGDLVVADEATQRERLIAIAEHQDEFTPNLVWSEWRDVVDAWQIGTLDDYRTVPRLGRQVRLTKVQRERLWVLFDEFRSGLARDGLTTESILFAELTEHVKSSDQRPFDYVIVDEAQDVSVGGLRLLGAIAGDRVDGLFFAGDLAQRIFRTPFSWQSLGVSIRGRSKTLRINYRTSHQIRMRADRLLGNDVSDVDGIEESRRGVVSAFNGPHPVVELYDSEQDERDGVASWLRNVGEDYQPGEIALVVRTNALRSRAEAMIEASGLPIASGRMTASGHCDGVTLTTMHEAKGREFRVVGVVCCDEGVLPLASRLGGMSTWNDIEEVTTTERQLFYVACTRARDLLLVTGVRPGSEFLDDLGRST